MGCELVVCLCFFRSLFFLPFCFLDFMFVKKCSRGADLNNYYGEDTDPEHYAFVA